MAIAIPTYSPGSIATYTDLIAEIRDLSDDADYRQDIIDRAIRKAEAEFNRKLRAPEMETRTVLTITGELTQLPSDFLALRYIFQEGMPDSPMKSMSPAAMLSTYSGQAGFPSAYTIEGNFLRVGPVGNATVELLYSASIPPLSDAQVSNWLLRLHPDLYVAGVMFYLATRERDQQGMNFWSGLTSSLMEDINGAAQRNRWGAGPLVPAGLKQVRRIRA